MSSLIHHATNPPAMGDPCFAAIDFGGDRNPDNLDDYSDLVFYFDTQALAAALGPVMDGQVITLTLTGKTASGHTFSASDDIIIRKKGNGQSYGKLPKVSDIRSGIDLPSDS